MEEKIIQGWLNEYRQKRNTIDHLTAENAKLRELLREANLFLSWLPFDLGRGSLNGKKVQVEYAIIQALKEAE